VTRRKSQGMKRVDQPSTFQDEAFTRLTEKLYRWLFLQPEWVHVLASERHVRRRYAAAIADAVTRIPPYVTAPAPQPKPFGITVGDGETVPGPDGQATAVPSAPPSPLPDYPGKDPEQDNLPDPEGDEKDRLAEAMMAEAEANDPRHDEDEGFQAGLDVPYNAPVPKR
jgi:hypothetical protein